MTRSATLAALAAILTLSTANADAGSTKRFGISLPGIGNISTPQIDLSKFQPRVSLPPVTLPSPPHAPLPTPIVRPPVTCPTPVPTPIPAPTVVRPVDYVQPGYRQWYFGMSLQRVSTQYGGGLQVYSVTPGAPAHQAGLEPGDILLASNSVSFATAQTNEHGVQMLQSSVDSFRPLTSLTVIDVRTQQVTHVVCGPRRMNAPAPTGGLPAPATAAPAPVASAPAPAASSTF